MTGEEAALALRVLVALTLGIWGVRRIAIEFKRAWRKRRDTSQVDRIGRLRLIAWVSFPILLLIVVGDLLMQGPKWLFEVGLFGILLGWVAFLILSFVWGAMGGLRA